MPSILTAVQPADHRCPQLLPAPGHSPEDAGYKKLAQEDTGQEEKNGSGWEGGLSWLSPWKEEEGGRLEVTHRMKPDCGDGVERSQGFLRAWRGASCASGDSAVNFRIY